jgi:hypothetical protein
MMLNTFERVLTLSNTTSQENQIGATKEPLNEETERKRARQETYRCFTFNKAGQVNLIQDPCSLPQESPHLFSKEQFGINTCEKKSKKCH